MNQYCRYCANALDYNGEGTDFICEAEAPCGNDGAGEMYPASKAKHINHCKYFVFNELDIFGQLEDGSFKKYRPQGKHKKAESKQIGMFDKAGEEKMTCKCAKPTDEWHGWECDITGGACMYIYPDSKACARDYGEGPDAETEREKNE